jgi:hypothetical protein
MLQAVQITVRVRFNTIIVSLKKQRMLREIGDREKVGAISWDEGFNGRKSLIYITVC